MGVQCLAFSGLDIVSSSTNSHLFISGLIDQRVIEWGELFREWGEFFVGGSGDYF